METWGEEFKMGQFTPASWRLKGEEAVDKQSKSIKLRRDQRKAAQSFDPVSVARSPKELDAIVDKVLAYLPEA